jgi:hypothetical protein
MVPINSIWICGTSGIYGDGGFFKLDLNKRYSHRLLPDPSATCVQSLEAGYFTRLEMVDREKNLISVGIFIYDETLTLVAQEEMPLE